MSENGDFGPDEMNKALFTHLVMSLASAAMTHLGKLVNPATGKTETNLDAAQANIDMLEMLAARTRGNLDKEEARMLEQTLTGLRMNYVETSSRPNEPASPAAAPEAAEAASTPDAAAEQHTAAAGPGAEPTEDKKRFTKKYD